MTGLQCCFCGDDAPLGCPYCATHKAIASRVVGRWIGGRWRRKDKVSRREVAVAEIENPAEAAKEKPKAQTLSPVAAGCILPGSTTALCHLGRDLKRNGANASLLDGATSARSQGEGPSRAERLKSVLAAALCAATTIAAMPAKCWPAL